MRLDVLVGEYKTTISSCSVLLCNHGPAGLCPLSNLLLTFARRKIKFLISVGILFYEMMEVDLMFQLKFYFFDRGRSLEYTSAWCQNPPADLRIPRPLISISFGLGNSKTSVGIRLWILWSVDSRNSFYISRHVSWKSVHLTPRPSFTVWIWSWNVETILYACLIKMRC